jgi:hypothetical protein
VIDGIVERFRKVRDWVLGEETPVEAEISGATGRIAQAQPQAGSGGRPQVTVQVSVDARGGSSEAGAAVQRALAQSSSATTQGVERALNRYGELAEGA